MCISPLTLNEYIFPSRFERVNICLRGKNRLPSVLFTAASNQTNQASQVARWLRICLPMQEHRCVPQSGKIIHSVGRLSPGTTTAEPTLQSQCSAARVAATVRSGHTATKRKQLFSRCSQRKPACSNEDPTQPKINEVNFLFEIVIGWLT